MLHVSQKECMHNLDGGKLKKMVLVICEYGCYFRKLNIAYCEPGDRYGKRCMGLIMWQRLSHQLA